MLNNLAIPEVGKNKALFMLIRLERLCEFDQFRDYELVQACLVASNAPGGHLTMWHEGEASRSILWHNLNRFLRLSHSLFPGIVI